MVPPHTARLSGGRSSNTEGVPVAGGVRRWVCLPRAGPRSPPPRGSLGLLLFGHCQAHAHDWGTLWKSVEGVLHTHTSLANGRRLAPLCRLIGIGRRGELYLPGPAPGLWLASARGRPFPVAGYFTPRGAARLGPRPTASKRAVQRVSVSVVRASGVGGSGGWSPLASWTSSALPRGTRSDSWAWDGSGGGIPPALVPGLLGADGPGGSSRSP